MSSLWSVEKKAWEVPLEERLEDHNAGTEDANIDLNTARTRELS
jgi:hypothetical protein